MVTAVREGEKDNGLRLAEYESDIVVMIDRFHTVHIRAHMHGSYVFVLGGNRIRNPHILRARQLTLFTSCHKNILKVS
jgi:hypothetical protein